MQVDKKQEVLRGTILAQAETIEGLRLKAQSLEAENERLRAEAHRARNLCQEYRRLIAGVRLQQDSYASLNRDMKKLKNKLRKVVYRQ